MSPRRGAWSRTLAAVAILTVAASGSGLPMCVSLLARAAAPCGMHQHARGGQETHGAQVAPGHDMDDACHASDDNVGCASGGSCPTGGTAALAAAAVLATFGPTRAVTPAIERAHLSFLSPPLPPPPQA